MCTSKDLYAGILTLSALLYMGEIEAFRGFSGKGRTKTIVPNNLMCTQPFPLQLQALSLLTWNAFLLVKRKYVTLLLEADCAMSLLKFLHQM